jgi:hypothetical protein
MALLAPRVQITLFAVLVFLVVGLPSTYELTDSLVARFGLDFVDVDGTPTKLGVATHACVAGLLTWSFLLTVRM